MKSKSCAFVIVDPSKGLVRTIIDGQKGRIERYNSISKSNYPSGHHFDLFEKSN